jgi:hypothetical protein
MGTQGLWNLHSLLRTRTSDANEGGTERERAAWLSKLLARELDRRGVVVASSRYRRDGKGRRQVR